MIQKIEWKSRKGLPCDRCPPVSVILCVNPTLLSQKACPIDPIADPEITDETNFRWQTIEAVAVSVETMGKGCDQWFLYTVTYDDSQLLAGHTLDPKDIHGVICDDTCLTSWVREQIGDDVSVILGDDDHRILINQHGCEFDLGTASGGGSDVEGSEAIDVVTAGSPSVATVSLVISPDADNIAVVHSNGLYVPPRTVSIVDNGDGTFEFFQDGVSVGTLDACIHCGGSGPLAPVILSEGFTGETCGATQAWSSDSFTSFFYDDYTPPQGHYDTITGPNSTPVCVRVYPVPTSGPYHTTMNVLQSGLPLLTRTLYVNQQFFWTAPVSIDFATILYTLINVHGISPNSVDVKVIGANTTSSATKLRIIVTDQVTGTPTLTHDVTVPNMQDTWTRLGILIQLNSAPATADGYVKLYINGGPSNPSPIYDSGLMILTTGTGDLTIVDVGEDVNTSGMSNENIRYVQFVNIYGGVPDVTQL